ncbi:MULTISPECIES: thioredoxin [unclassified Variovorax]|uniref:thioredoxin n=1 Tax=unclassified Variovorax TaxID=663243 RepID=UPI00076D414F|nr:MULTISPECIES: thioredoxin [unclassified Variovorax]KWT98474.1 Thioredoxin [Variovorax sp. WDL1]PNG49851.1 Thioredoxin-1 [Variovorax sp. B2]PNG50723.1 Thioredoxin-1 [Variovorax sp. B4]VTV17926.1 Thioredoxin 1 [Variovorax sp. WDL1]
MVASITDSTFEQDVVKSDVPVLVDFWAPWCGPCKLLAPVLDQLAANHEGKLKVVKVNIDEDREHAKKLAIRGVPTLVLYRDGEVVARASGAQSLGKLEAMVAA